MTDPIDDQKADIPKALERIQSALYQAEDTAACSGGLDYNSPAGQHLRREAKAAAAQLRCAYSSLLTVLTIIDAPPTAKEPS